MQGYYTRIPVEGPLSQFVRSFHVADAMIDRLTIDSPPTGYPVLGHVWRGFAGARVADTEQPAPPLPFNILAGQLYRTRASVSWSGGIGHAVAEFTATGLYELLGVKGSAVINAAMPVGMLDPDLDQQLLAAFDGAEAVEAFSTALTPRMDAAQEAPDYVRQAARMIEEARGDIRLKDICDHVEISERMLTKQFKDIVGLPPKYFARVVQFNFVGTLILMDEVESLAELAAQAGFFDQSHFAKAVQEFVLQSPKAFLHGSHENLSTFVRQMDAARTDA